LTGKKSKLSCGRKKLVLSGAKRTRLLRGGGRGNCCSGGPCSGGGAKDGLKLTGSGESRNPKSNVLLRGAKYSKGKRYKGKKTDAEGGQRGKEGKASHAGRSGPQGGSSGRVVESYGRRRAQVTQKENEMVAQALKNDSPLQKEKKQSSRKTSCRLTHLEPRQTIKNGL